MFILVKQYQLISLQNEAVAAVLHDVSVYSNEVVKHCQRVCSLSVAIGKAIGLEGDTLMDLGIAALLHDCGKSFIPKDVLFKEGPLESEEFECVKEHVDFGVQLLRASGISERIVSIVKAHHERVDGSGYPEGDRCISVEAGILAVADVFDAMVHKRCYKSALTVDYAVDFIRSGAGTKFYRRVVDEFEKIVVRNCNGCCGSLNDQPITSFC